MAENPLLPHDRLRELHARMQRCERALRGLRSDTSAREAFIAGTTIHLVRGDLLCARPEEFAAATSSHSGENDDSGNLLMPKSLRRARLPLCAAAARGLQLAGTGLVLALARSGGVEPGWKDSMLWAQTARLPLILACSDSTGGDDRTGARSPEAASLTFAALSRFAKRAELPVLTVDGEDAVAVYRVAQECALRARHGGGPAVLWAVVSKGSARSTGLKRVDTPLARMQRYMRAHGVS